MAADQSQLSIVTADQSQLSIVTDDQSQLSIVAADLRDGGGEAEGDEDEDEPEGVLCPDVVLGLDVGLQVLGHDVHRHVELQRVGEGDRQRHHHLHQRGQPAGTQL